MDLLQNGEIALLLTGAKNRHQAVNLSSFPAVPRNLWARCWASSRNPLMPSSSLHCCASSSVSRLNFVSLFLGHARQGLGFRV